jgi:hypothetical protein
VGDRKTIKVGDLLTSGAPVAGSTLTKVHAAQSVEDLDAADEKFDQAARLQALLEQTRKAIAALNKPVGRGG